MMLYKIVYLTITYKINKNIELIKSLAGKRFLFLLHLFIKFNKYDSINDRFWKSCM
jgi:hypothetical protein